MKQRPILFCVPMVRAILDGSKRMTRRVVKDGHAVVCPYGVEGDQLWVKEEHYAFGKWERDGFTKKGRPKWHFVRTGGIQIEPPKSRFRTSRDHVAPRAPQWYKRIARFMPKSVSRITLEVTRVRVDRLHDISGTDAIAEGIESYTAIMGDAEVTTFRDYLTGKTDRAARNSFETLWIRLNGRESWDANPLVWVVEFVRV